MQHRDKEGRGEAPRRRRRPGGFASRQCARTMTAQQRQKHSKHSRVEQSRAEQSRAEQGRWILCARSAPCSRWRCERATAPGASAGLSRPRSRAPEQKRESNSRSPPRTSSGVLGTLSSTLAFRPDTHLALLCSCACLCQPPFFIFFFKAPPSPPSLPSPLFRCSSPLAYNTHTHTHISREIRMKRQRQRQRQRMGTIRTLESRRTLSRILRAHRSEPYAESFFHTFFRDLCLFCSRAIEPSSYICSNDASVLSFCFII